MIEAQTISAIQNYLKEYNTGENEENKPIADLPFDVSKDLDQFSKIFVSSEFDSFRNIHCLEKCYPSFDFVIYGELPDGDKKLLFTCTKHNQFCKCCDTCSIPFCCWEYFCCNSIIFQMDYRRNNKTFYTQGINMKKGCTLGRCFCCSLFCCCCCSCSPNALFLRENTQPDNPDFNVGNKKGVTYGIEHPCCGDKVVTYISQSGEKGPKISKKGSCCQRCCCCSCECTDYIIDIEDGKGGKFGNIVIPNGCNSVKVKDLCCHLPRKYYEINITEKITSEQKFQIIADIIQFTLLNFD